MTLTVKKIEAARPQDRPYKLADAPIGRDDFNLCLSYATKPVSLKK